MYIEAKVLGGESITNACQDAINLANRIGCDVHFKFNDVTCMALVGHNAEDLEAAWWSAFRSNTSYKIAASHPRAPVETKGGQS